MLRKVQYIRSQFDAGAKMADPKFSREIQDVGFNFLGQLSIQKFKVGKGKIEAWESVFSPKTLRLVNVVALTPEKNLILVKLFRFPVESWVYELPGGLAEENEGLVQAAERELLEETGYSSKSPLYYLGEGWVFNSRSNACYSLFLAHDCTKIQEPSLDPVEKAAGLEVMEMSIKEIYRRITNYSKEIDLRICQAIVMLQAKNFI